ncbi:MAG: glucosamine-6-phosphate deaminase [bacterium]|nr:glucosamine-6-phosphate deaminase [bacterium]
MNVIIVKDKDELGKVGAQIIATEMKKKAVFVLGGATGSTPIPVYKELIRLHKEEGLDFSSVITFNLDEYVGLPGNHDQSYRYFMDTNLFNHININKKNTFVPDGMAKDIAAFCAQYEEMIKDVGGIDVQILGIGSNGHIAFNEPPSSLASRTRQVFLTESTIKDNARFFAKIEDVPTSAISMGIGTILEAKKILLFANGANKADAVAKSIEGPITAMVPASALQLHPDVTFILTEDCTGKLIGKYRK